MTKPVLRHNFILGPFPGRNVPFAGRHADESLHPVSIPYSAMPCNMLKMKLRMPSQRFWPSSEGVVFILSNFRHLTWAMELLCLLDLFMLLDEITICSWVSERCVSLSHSGLGTELLSGAKWAILQSFLFTQFNVARTILTSLAPLFTFIIKLNCMWLHVCNCMFCCKCFNASAWFCLGVIITEVEKKIVLPPANILKLLFFLSSETAFCLMAVKRWSQRIVASAHKPLTFNFSCKQNTEITG